MFTQYIYIEGRGLVDIREFKIFEKFTKLLDQGLPSESDNTELIVTTTEAVNLTKHKQQTLYNLINKGVFKEGTHYYKPSKGKLLWDKSALLSWLKNNGKELPVEKKPDNTEESRDHSKKGSTQPGRNTANKEFINI